VSGYSDAEWAWWLVESEKEIRGEDSWLSFLGLLIGTRCRHQWPPGERETFEAWKAKALGLNNPLTGCTV